MVVRKQRMGTFPRLEELRTQLGLSPSELLAKISYAVSDRSLRRLESGKAIRLTSVNKLFHAVNNEMNQELVHKEEVVQSG